MNMIGYWTAHQVPVAIQVATDVERYRDGVCSQDVRLEFPKCAKLWSVHIGFGLDFWIWIRRRRSSCHHPGPHARPQSAAFSIPANSYIEQGLMVTMATLHSPDKTFDLEKLDDRPVTKNTDEVLLFLVARNEIAKLPYFLFYYRNLGIGRFFVVDDKSDDGSREFLLHQRDCHVFHPTNSFQESQCGTRWQDLLSDTYGTDCWCLAVDADELLVYPDCEKIALPSFCKFLDSEGSAAFFAFLLDMYPGTDLSKAICVPGKPFQDICPFFDTDYVFMELVESNEVEVLPPIRVVGGPRMRKFYPWQTRTDFFSRALASFTIRLADKLHFWRGDKPHYAPALLKVPLVKWQVGCRRLSNHIIAKPKEGTLSTVRGALLHFKFFADFHDKAKWAVATGQHYRGSQEYVRYLASVSRDPHLTFMYHGSHLYTDSNSLLRTGIIKTNAALESYVSTLDSAF
jgi:Glycosyl transferase family 2